MKKILNIITTIILFIFSMIYTKKAIMFLQNKDPLMKEIKDHENDYYIKPIDAIITNNYMIPGLSGRKINIINSYKKMKKLNSFNESLIVYDYLLPSKSINNNYDKVIIKGNTFKKNVAIILNVSNYNNYIDINNILLNNNYYLDIYSNNKIDIANTNFKNIVSDKSNNYNNFCLYMNKINESCINKKKYTINAYSIKSLQEVKNTLSNGIIYLYKISNIDDLNIIIKYIKNNNYDIKSLDELIKE